MRSISERISPRCNCSQEDPLRIKLGEESSRITSAIRHYISLNPPASDFMTDSQTNQSLSKPAMRSWLRLSLRGLLILVVAFCVFVAWFCYHFKKAKRENEIAKRYLAKATELAGSENFNYIYFSIYFANEDGLPNNKTIKSLAPAWLRQFSGDNLFSHVKSICFNDNDDLDFISIFDEEIDLSKLDFVSFRACFKLKNLDCLKKCPNITKLAIEYCQIEDYSELKNLKKLNSLSLNLQDDDYRTILKLVLSHPVEKIHLSQFYWDPEVVGLLCKIKTIKHLDLRGGTTRAPKALADKLHEAFPDAEILYHLEEWRL